MTDDDARDDRHAEDVLQAISDNMTKQEVLSTLDCFDIGTLIGIVREYDPETYDEWAEQWGEPIKVAGIPERGE